MQYKLTPVSETNPMYIVVIHEKVYSNVPGCNSFWYADSDLSKCIDFIKMDSKNADGKDAEDYVWYYTIYQIDATKENEEAFIHIGNWDWDGVTLDKSCPEYFINFKKYVFEETDMTFQENVNTFEEKAILINNSWTISSGNTLL